MRSHIRNLHNIVLAIVVVVVNDAHLSLSVFSLSEQAVHIFECETLCLWEEEIDNWYPYCVESL